MPFEKYVPQNNAQGALLSGISSVATTMILQSGQGGRFPSTFPYLCELKQVDTVAPFAVLKREIVKVTGKAGDTLTIVRSFGTCLPNDASNTPGTTAFSFSSGDTVTLTVTAETIEDIQDEVSTKLATYGGLRTGFGSNKTVYIDPATGNEVVKDTSLGSSIGDTELIISRDATTGNENRVPFSDIKANILSASGSSITDSVYESTIVAGDMVGSLPDCVGKITPEVNSSTAVGGTNGYLGQCVVGPNKHAILYLSGGNLKVIIATISDANIVSYGTAVNVMVASAGSGGIALIDTDKIVITFTDNVSSTSHTVSSFIGTITGTNVAIGTPLNEVIATSSMVVTISSVYKVRATACGYTIYGTFVFSQARVNSISGTTITAGTTIFAGGANTGTLSGCYLSDNYIAITENTSVSNQTKGFIFLINSGSTAVQTTYSAVLTAIQTTSALCRYSNTEFVYTNGNDTGCVIVGVPGAGLTLTITSLTANVASGYGLCAISDGIFAIHTGSSFIIKQRDYVIGTITGVPAHPLGYGGSEQLAYSRGKILIVEGSTLIPRIISLARVFLIGVALNTEGVFSVSKFSTNLSGVLRGYRYWLQADGTKSTTVGITNTASQVQLIGRGVAPDKLMIEI